MSTETKAIRRSGPAFVLQLPGAGTALVHRRGSIAVAVLVAVVIALAMAAVAVGTRWIPLDDVARGLVGVGDSGVVLTVREFRLPRVAVGILVGLALGLAGAIVQGVTRNPIAAPDVIGVTAGASLGAVVVLLAFGGTTFGYGGAAAALSRVGVPLGAVAGAFAAAALVLGLSVSRRWPGRDSGLRFSVEHVVLAGIVCHAAFLGLVHWGLASGDVDQAAKAATWLVGSLHGRGWEHVGALAVAIAVLGPLALLLGRQLAALALGEPSAATLGVRVGRAQLGLLAVAFALTGVAVAAAGPVDFVALLAPQIARRLVRSSTPPLAASALTGAAVLLAADLLARLAIPGMELPAGAVTALVGAPFLLWLVVRHAGSRARLPRSMEG